MSLAVAQMELGNMHIHGSVYIIATPGGAYYREVGHYAPKGMSCKMARRKPTLKWGGWAVAGIEPSPRARISAGEAAGRLHVLVHRAGAWVAWPLELDT